MTEQKTLISQRQFYAMAAEAAARIKETVPGSGTVAAQSLTLYGVPRGGITALYAILPYLAPIACFVTDDPSMADVIVDDIYDSGRTAEYYANLYPGVRFQVIFDKRDPTWKDKWLVMPYEVTKEGNDESATDICTRLLEFIGEDPNREGLRETPRRWLKAWQEWAQGYKLKPADLLKSFEDGAENVDELVIVHNIPVMSKCEHHLADIQGIAHVGYIPNGRIVGLSKLARVVDAFSRRLQVQERLTNQIADLLNQELKPLGVGVLITAAHGCMSSRGVKIHGATTTTSAMRGALLDKPAARAEFISLCDKAERNRFTCF